MTGQNSLAMKRTATANSRASRLAPPYKMYLSEGVLE